VERGVTERLYTDGIDAVDGITSSFTSSEWQQPACGSWSALDTVRHLAVVATWYHQWLDRALAGDASAPFPERDFDERNASALDAMADVDATHAVENFRHTAIGYLTRVVDHWDAPFGYPVGTVTVGLHLGVAATEWHLHAHDLASSVGRSYTPRDPAQLLMAAGSCVAETKPRLRRAMLRRMLPLASRRSPWPSLLRESGRTESAATHRREGAA
jgi:hypothetical protein